MFRLALPILCLLILSTAAMAQPSTAGDVMFVGFNADGTDGFAIVTLVDVPNGTVIHFSDNEWGGAAFNNTDEGEATWTNDTGGTIGEGTVLIFTDMVTTPTASQGAMSGETINLNTSNEILYAYLGTATVPTTFLSGIANDDFTQNTNTLAGTGLTVDTTAIESDNGLGTDEDVMVYDGPNNCDSLTKVQCQMQVADVTSNWSSQDGAGDQSQDSTFPDFPDHVVGNFSTVPVELLFFRVK